ncbi:MAG: hypothetical protein RBQ94_04935 [Methanimicrococcus sp.]|nr:hypothetical protein [Methanimicrococcus sp.]
MTDVGQELLNVPFPEMVLSLANAIAEGQFNLDQTSCKIAAMMGDAEKYPIELPDLADGNKTIKTSMIGAGFQPTFYQFTDTIIEVKMAITMTKTTEASVSVNAKAKFLCFSASVNASYSSKYTYSVEGSSLLRTKITPLPPNAFMQNLLDLKAQKEQMKFQLEMKKLEAAIEKEQKEIDKKIKEEEDKSEKESKPAAA